MKTSTKSILILIIIVVVICIGVFNVKNNPEEKSVIKIGGISALTGVGATVGNEERKGEILAVEDVNKAGGINGRKLELVSEDLSIDKINKATSIAQKLINVDKVTAIVGAQWDETTIPMLPIIEKSQVPVVGCDNSDQLEKDQDYPYYFSTWYNDRVGVRELLRYAKTHEIKRVSIIKFLSAGFWEFTARSMTKDAPDYGVQIVDELDLGNPTSLDFRTQIIKANESKPDAIFIVTSDFNQCTFLKQKMELGVKTITLGTESTADGASLVNCPSVMEGRFWSAPKGGKNYTDFESRFEKRFGAKPNSPSAATAYDAVMVIVDALKKTNGEGGARLRNAIQATNITGVSLDNISFNQKGYVMTPEDTFSMKTIKDGVVVDVN